MVPPLDPRERALVVTAFISLPRNATKHGYQSLRHSLKVPADYYMYCSDALQCAQMQEARRPVDARGVTSAVQQLTYEQLVRSLAQRIDVSVDALLAAARSSVHRAPGWGGHCPSAEIILIWLAKPLLVELAMRVHPTRRLFAWVDAGLTPYASKDPPTPPWEAMTLSVLNGALAIRRQVGACHNRRRLTPLNRTCPIGTWLFGSPYAWRAVSELRIAKLIAACVRGLFMEPLWVLSSSWYERKRQTFPSNSIDGSGLATMPVTMTWGGWLLSTTRVK